MADNARVEELQIKITTVKQALAQSRADIAAVGGDLTKLKAQTAASADVVSKLNTEFQKISRQKYLTSLVKDVTDAERGTHRWITATAKLNAELGRLKATEGEIANVARSIASAADSTRAAQSAGSGFAASGDSGGSGQISPGLSRFGAKARFLLPAINVGGISSEGLSKIVQVIGALPTVTAPVLLAVGGLAAGFVALESSLSGAKRTLELAVQANKAYFDAIREGLTTEDVQSNIGKLSDKIAADSTELATLEGAFEGAASDALDTYGLLIGGFLTTLGKLSSADDANAARADELRKSLEADRATLQRLTDEVDKNSFAAADAAKAEEELAKKREETLPRLQQLADQANDLILRNQEQVGQISEDRRIRDARAEEDWQIQRSAQLENHLDNLARIDNAGIERLVAIRVAGNEKIAQANAQIEKLNLSIANVATKLRDDLAKVDRDFMRDEREDYEAFRQQVLKDDRAFAKERARTIEDLNNDLADLEASNDVSAFVRRQRDGEIELRRQAEDQDEKTQQEQAAFEEERRIAAQRRDERIADLQAAAEERRADLQQEIAEREAAKVQILKDVQDQLIAERERIDATRQATIDAFNEQQKRDEEARNLRLKRQSEDDALQDKRRLDQLNKQLADIALKAQKEAEAIGLVGNSLTQLVSAVQNGVSTAIAGIVSRASSAGGGVPGFGANSSYLTPSGGTSFSSTKPGQAALGFIGSFFGASSSNVAATRQRLLGNRLLAFADGGIPTAPTLGMLSEKPGWLDAVIPFQKSEGFGNAARRMGLGGGQSINVNLYGDIGNGMSPEAVRSELESMGQTIITAVTNARYGKRE